MTSARSAPAPAPARLEILVPIDSARSWAARANPGDSISVSGCCLTLTTKPRPLRFTNADKLLFSPPTVDRARTLPTTSPNPLPNPVPTPLPNRAVVLSFDVVPETLRRTSLGDPSSSHPTVRVARRVNLEPALRADSLLGGHLVQGHIDATARVIAVPSLNSPHARAEWRVRFELEDAPPSLSPAPHARAADAMKCIVEKGSICIDGVSLTVAAVASEKNRPAKGARSSRQPNRRPGRREWFEVALIPTTLAQTTLADLRPGDRVNIETDILARTVVAWLERVRQ